MFRRVSSNVLPAVLATVGGWGYFCGLEGEGSELGRVLAGFDAVDDGRAAEIAEVFVAEIRQGYADLQAGRESGTSLKLINSHVPDLPDGMETGESLVVEVGGSTLRGSVVSLLGKHEVSIAKMKDGVTEKSRKEKDLDEWQKGCEADAERVKGMYERFLEPLDKATPEDGALSLPLAFTFSFPIHQTSTDEGSLIHWTKGWRCAELVGNDVVAPLRRALAAQEKFRSVPLRALVNDTVGVLMLARYRNPSTELGLVMGTGTNAAYLETEERYFGRSVSGARAAAAGKKGMVVVNSEWGGFGSKGGRAAELLGETQFDKTLDAKSEKPGTQRFEKMVSGKYIGQIAAAALQHLRDAGEISAPLDLSKFSAQSVFDCVRNKGVGKALGLPEGSKLSDHEQAVVMHVCGSVARRAARLTAAAIAGVIKHRGLEGEVGVGVDGSVFRCNADFSSSAPAPDRIQYQGKGYDGWVQDTLRAIVPQANVTFVDAADGSGIGAAIVAAIVHPQDTE